MRDEEMPGEEMRKRRVADEEMLAKKSLTKK